jgi:hypothetical protein
MEQRFIQARLLEVGVAIRTGEALSRVTVQGLTTACVYTGKERLHETANVVLVTSRKADDALYGELKRRNAAVTAIGDAWAPPPSPMRSTPAGVLPRNSTSRRATSWKCPSAAK